MRIIEIVLLLFVTVQLGSTSVAQSANGVIDTVAGNGAIGYRENGGPATAAQLFNPYGLAVDAAGNC
jgi:hypothetical protein